ncbi:7-carboxy-7-deazaguanine synthase [Nitrosopumilus zosterae]|uniref:7-carboxy-7-deazaguanine synthase n=1 Tax=Nitrosopumilus zosterae TaxID=718286 RepID=A0A2S2KTQ1_9ARCH|nr:7-carboxy-7-deazaguanine synthase QueE [Nitrosopumilus zosterae]BDQ31933.1 7-carboxy-7-deazaguanine synthase QueE [Nitrosopumilus zosterae]GBH35022.1 7-carboxy-7-deazaguanine synthase [Nitrosopumilus zosterae]
MKVRLFEIFTSVEGEGILYGTKTLFIRLAGCPFTCFYCDTKESLPLDSGTEYAIEEANRLIDSNLQRQTYKVNFTGGDPLIQHQAVALLAKHVQDKKIPTYLESSCFDIDRFNHVLPFIDIVKIEFKTKDSDFVDSDHYEKLIDNTMKCLKSSIEAKKITYIKIVVSSKTKLDEFKELVNQIFKIVSKDDIDGFIIQPTYGISEPSLDLLLNLYDVVYPYYIDVKVVPQLHKFIGAP